MDVNRRNYKNHGQLRGLLLNNPFNFKWKKRSLLCHQETVLISTHSAVWNQQLKTKERSTLQASLPTILCEFGRRKLCRNEERLFGATLEDETGGNIRAAIVVFFAAGQAQVQGMVVKCAILITL